MNMKQAMIPAIRYQMSFADISVERLPRRCSTHSTDPISDFCVAGTVSAVGWPSQSFAASYCKAGPLQHTFLMILMALHDLHGLIYSTSLVSVIECEKSCQTA